MGSDDWVHEAYELRKAVETLKTQLSAMTQRAEAATHEYGVIASENHKLRAQLATARRKALEEAAKVVERQDFQDRNGAGVAEDIRALASTGGSDKGEDQ